MTDEEMRIAIAEACGWKKPDDPEVMKFKVGWTSAEKWWMCPKGVLRLKHDLPDYLNDLNAMHEAEKTFADDDVIAEKYWLALYDATEHTRWPYDATARQRAEAFLKTKGIIP